MSLLPFVEWCDSTAIGTVIKESVWLFPAIMVVHLLALALFGGVLLAVDLRLMGFGLRARPAADLARDLRPWTTAALAALLGSGALLFVSEALRLYETPPFWVKMGLLTAALLFTCTVRRRVVGAAVGHVRPGERLTGALSATLWVSVAVAGRAVGFW